MHFRPHFSIVTASFKPSGETGTISITVKNEGDRQGSATVKVRQERSQCAEVDENYCREHPPAPGTTCEPPCRRWETTVLGNHSEVTGVVGSCRETVVAVEVLNEASYVEITVVPGGNLGFGLEIAGR
ncbi:MAG: hypothetical protein ABR524_04150 [Thermoanaerobaculia bacterium]